MTASALIKSLKPGEVAIRCADGSLLQTVAADDFGFAHQRRPVNINMSKLMRKLTALKQDKKR
jgi:hypothetical protein